MDVIGRDHELDLLCERVRRHRLVTVVGPGGIGKTSVAATAARRLEPEFPLGSHVVDLARVDASEEVGAAMAGQLGFPSLTALLSTPGEQPALVVLDNCEHVLDGVAETVDALLAACESPRVLATSRSPIGLPGEALVVLGPLMLPGPGPVDADVASVRLFLERARTAAVEIDDDGLDAVGALCTALDGVPLAIEIAAARSRTMTPRDMLARFGDLDLWSRPRFRGIERHRSLRSTIEWSYAMLDDADRIAFDRLAVLHGPFDLAAAHAVAGEPTAPESETLERLDALVDASLLVVDRSGPAARFRQLALLRSFATERLEAGGELGWTTERFVDHVARVAASLDSDGGERWEPAPLAVVAGLREDVLAALRWCLDHDTDPDRAFALSTPLRELAHQGQVEEIGETAERVLGRWPGDRHGGWHRAAAAAVTCRYLRGRPGPAVELAAEAVARPACPPHIALELRRIAALSTAATDDLRGALGLAEQAAGDARSAGIEPVMLDMLRAQLLAELGDVEAALDVARRVRREVESGGLHLHRLRVEAIAAHLLVGVDTPAAESTLAEVLDAAQRSGDGPCASTALEALALARLDRGDPVGAAGHIAAALEGSVGRGAISELRSTLHNVAAVLHRLGDPAWEPLEATALTLPAVDLLDSPGHERVRLGPVRAAPLAVRDAVLLARARLAATAEGPVAGAAHPAAPPGPASEERSFVREGDVWRISFRGRTIGVRHSKGLADLARLLSAPEREVHCLDLAGGAVDQPSTGEVIDSEARRRYEQRLLDLQDEIDEADRHHDRARAERAQAEFDELVEHLSAALGLGGGVRRAPGTSERARSAVTQRVRSAIRRIDAEHPELGRHLHASVETGVYCSYRPEQPSEWRT